MQISYGDRAEESDRQCNESYSGELWSEFKERKAARCSSVVRAFAHGAMDRRIVPPWWTH